MSIRAVPDQSDKVSDKDVDIENSTTSSLKGSVKEREGGLQAWLTVLGSCLVYFATFGIINSFGFFQTLYTKEYLPETPSSTIAFIGTIQMLLMNLLAAPAGSLFDCFGLKVGVPEGEPR